MNRAPKGIWLWLTPLLVGVIGFAAVHPFDAPLNAAAVTGYLAGGGSFFLSSMEVLSRMRDERLGTFSRDVLGVQSFTEDDGVPQPPVPSGAPAGQPTRPGGDDKRRARLKVVK